MPLSCPPLGVAFPTLSIKNVVLLVFNNPPKDSGEYHSCSRPPGLAMYYEERKLQQLVITQPGPIISASRLTNISKFSGASGGRQKVLLIQTALRNKHLGTICHRRGNVSTLLSVIPPYSCNSLLCQVCYDYQQSK